ncbi:ATP-binding protein [Asticcacaulis taihuensis]|uniref:ATP-binding protein n=1 Tax=Asticcacaulis taihuensis TaxID=260084 RepID=UPI003F7C1CD3
MIRDSALYFVSILFITLLALGVSMQMGHGMLIGGSEIALMAGVVCVSALFGFTAGMLILIVLYLTWHGVFGTPLLSPTSQTPELLLQVLFGCAVAATGLFSDAVRRRYRFDRGSLPAVGRAMPKRGPGVNIEDHLNIWHRLVALGRMHQDPVRLIAGVGCTVICFGVAWSLQDMLGAVTCVLIILMGTAGAAWLTGHRVGALLATVSALSLTVLPGALGHEAWLTPVNGLFSVLVFSGTGWAIGSVSDGRRHERMALRTLIQSGRAMAISNEEVVIRCQLFDGLTALAFGGLIELIREGVDAAALPDAANWKSSRLLAQGREVGTARWRFYGPDRQQIRADAAIALCDLAAANIVRVRLEQEKSGMAFEARTEHLRTILLDAVSHHFRSPLAGILGSVTSILTLPDPPDPHAQRELLLIIKEQANRLSRYVDNFLSVARLESGAIEVRPAEVDLEALIYDVWESFGEAGGGRRFLKVTGVAGGLRTDPALLGQVLGNILENAIKYSEEESVVDVHIWRAEGRVMIQVTDQGPGIPPASQKRMFERFFRSPGARVPGLGLGLYITRSLVEILAGDVQASNRAHGGPGLAVTIALPGEGGVV